MECDRTLTQKELWIEQKEANYEARQILGIGPMERIMGDLPEEAVRQICLDAAEWLRDKTLSEGNLMPWQSWCSKCGRVHYDDSNIGKKHWKYGVKNFFVPNSKSEENR